MSTGLGMAIHTLQAYLHARRRPPTSRAALEAFQQRALDTFRRHTLPRSPWFAALVDRPFADWPLMDKHDLMQHFDTMNTAGLKADTLWHFVQESERTRHFGNWHGYSVGLSSGTSGRRALFVASPRERERWAGTMLAKVFAQTRHDRHLKRRPERVALFLRSGSDLYQAVNTPWLSLAYFDLFAALTSHFARLQAMQPSIIVAPAQVLHALADALHTGTLQLKRLPRIISVAEVLPETERHWLEETFPRVDQIYQATEGFLGITCAHGNLHLNETLVHVEPRWLDDTRFMPIITDFSRHTQPIVRYLLDDVLHTTHRTCPCGDPSRVIDAIDGRHDDLLRLPGIDRGSPPVVVFADVIHRALARALPATCEYRLVQLDADTLELALADDAPEIASSARDALIDLFRRQGIDTSRLTWQSRSTIDTDFTRKRRRIERRWRELP